MKRIINTALFFTLPLALAASGPAESRALAPDGECGTGKFEAVEVSDGTRIGPGEHWFCLRDHAKLDIEMVSGGGGGGGASDTHDSWGGTGNGGASGQYLFKRFDLPRGVYLLIVGKGGAGGQSRGRAIHATNGVDGGPTVLAYRSGLPIEALKGGKGGTADLHSGGGASQGGDGTSLVNPKTGEKIGSGGPGSIWMTSGQPAGGFGSGGGGSVTSLPANWHMSPRSTIIASGSIQRSLHR